ncbi:MAG: protein kinase [Kofleriaceae bacterium]
MTPSRYPLTALECELLEAVARDRGDEAALSVLADYWSQQGDEARGAYTQLQLGELGERLDLADEEARLSEHALRWRRPAIDAGYAEADLVFDRAVLQHPLAVPAGGPLDDHPDILRISPRYYRERRRVRQGGDFDVFEADVVTPMGTVGRVALKSVAPWWRTNPPFPLLEREATILAGIAHRNVPRALGWAIRPNGRALVLSWGGISLEALLDESRHHARPLGLAFTISVALQLCDALEALHAGRIVHRELRPDHVLVSTDGVVTVIDYGYVGADTPMWNEARYGYGPGQISPGPSTESLISRGGYMSPEQVEGRDLTGATDVFSLGLVIAELVDGTRAVSREQSGFEIIMAIRDGRLTLPVLPAPFMTVLQRMLAREAVARPSPAVVRAELERAVAATRTAVGPHVIAQILCELGVPA